MVSVEANTRDIGLAISSFLKGRTFSNHHENDDGGTLDPVADAAIEAIDASDPNNLVLMLDGGQRFTVRIIAGALTGAFAASFPRFYPRTKGRERL